MSPADAERHARLYYDPSCGPCTFLADSVRGLSDGRVESVPFNEPAAEADLGALAPTERYGSAHLVEDGRPRRSGPAIAAPLARLALGPTAGALLDRLPVLRRPLEWTYGRFWSHRQRHGCATRG